MSKLIVHGPTTLNGRIRVAGSKNHALPMMAACLLVDGVVKLHNAPHISDIDVMADMFSELGVTVKRDGTTLTIDASALGPHIGHLQDARRMRASVLVLGGAIGRMDRIAIAQPGGDIIGARSLGVHNKIFEQLGFAIHATAEGVELSGRLKPNQTVNAELGVTPTENAILAAVLGQGTTTIRLAACEPHVVELCNFLNALGAKISGMHSYILTIEAVERLNGGEGTIIPDQLEAGTLAIAAAASRGTVVIEEFVREDHDMLLLKFEEMGVNFSFLDERTLEIKPAKELRAVRIQTQPYPGLPSDLQAPFAVLMTQAEGKSEICEMMYEGRLNYLFELQRMGAETSIRDPHTGMIEGPTRLHGTDVISFDIRAGATILIAALIAEGVTTIDRVEHIDRGYEFFDKRLGALGARMERVD